MSKMKFAVISCLLLVSTLFSAPFALADAPKPDQPKVEPAEQTETRGVPTLETPETVYDFGVLFEDQTVVHDFVVKNTGNAPLRILRVKTSCGCAIARYDRVIPPGGEGKITLKVKLLGFHGPVTKSALAVTNDPQNPRTTLSVKGKVQIYVEVKPETIGFQGMKQTALEQVVYLTSPENPFHIESVKSDIDDKIDYSLETVQEGMQYRLRVANKFDEGAYRGHITIQTDIPNRPSIMIPVTGYIEGVIATRPPSLLLGKIHPNAPVKPREIMVVNNKNEPFKITSLTYDKRLLNVAQTKSPQGEAYVLTLAPNLNNVPKGGQYTTSIKIETDATPGRTYEVQVYLINR